MKTRFTSTKIAFFLLAILLFLILCSAIIPQKDIAVGQIIDMKEAMGEDYQIIELLQLDKIYTSPYFFFIVGLLAVNLVYGNIKRFRIIYKTERTLLKTKHIGSIIFHFSLILIMTGVILNYLYRFEGLLSLTEGQKVSDNENNYGIIVTGPLYKSNYGSFEIALKSFYPKYNFLYDYTEAALIDLNFSNESNILNDTVYYSHPVMWKDIEFHYGTQSGFSPEVVLYDSLDNMIYKSFVRIANQKEENIDNHFDFLLLQKFSLKIYIQVLPDSSSNKSTLFHIKVDKSDKMLYEDTLELSEKIRFDVYQIEIPRVRRWCYISVIKNPFLPWIFIGFWTALAGLMINLIPRVLTESKKT